MPQPGQPWTPYSYTQQPPTGQTTGSGSWAWDAGKGIFKWVVNNSGDLLQTGAGLVEGYMSSQDRQRQLEELKRQYDASLKQRQSEQTTSAEQYEKDLQERIAARNQSGTQFERTTGDTEAQAAVRAQTQLNAAPMADKAQALLLARMGVAPGQFQGRDYTKGTSDLTRNAVVPSANVTSAMQSAAANYRPGEGGVDTSTMRMLLDKMKASGFKPSAPTTPPPIGEPRPRLPFPPTLPPSTSRPPLRIPTVPPEAFPPPTATAPPDEPSTETEDDSPAGILRRRMTGVT